MLDLKSKIQKAVKDYKIYNISKGKALRQNGLHVNGMFYQMFNEALGE